MKTQTSKKTSGKVTKALSTVQRLLLTPSFGAQVPFKFAAARTADRHPIIRDSILAVWGVQSTMDIIRKDVTITPQMMAERNIATARVVAEAGDRAKFDWVCAATQHNQINPLMKQELNKYISDTWPDVPTMKPVALPLLEVTAPAGF